MSEPSVTVVVSTYQRRELCRRAVASALAQKPPVLEVLVADDGSTDGTPAMLDAWSREEPRLRVSRPARRAGRPAPPRNRALKAARGDLVAFLDDDDEWLPGKLSAQVPLFAEGADVVATNAVASDGTRYFPHAPELWWPRRADLLRGNPVVLSSALVRRDAVARVGGFPEEEWLAGVEDYALWLSLADAGCHFAVIGKPLVRYADHGVERLSHGAVRNQFAVARLFWRRWRARPGDLALRRAAVSKASYALTVAKERVIAR